MNKVTSVFCRDLLEKYSKNQLIVMLACFSRNGFTSGLATNEILNHKSHLSYRTIEKELPELAKDGEILISFNGKRRCVEIVSETFQNHHKILSYFLLKECKQYKGQLVKADKVQSCIFIQNNQVVYKCIIREKSPIFYVPIGNICSFNGYLIIPSENNLIQTIWIDELTFEDEGI